MTEETEPLQHPDFVSTWKPTTRGARESLWIPYLQSIESVPRSKRWRLTYNGGVLETDLSRVDTVFFYGATGDLPLSFLDAANQHRIVLILHRRNIPVPSLFLPSHGLDEDDLLSKQLFARQNMHDATYVGRTLIRARFDSMGMLISISATNRKVLAGCRNIDEVRTIESTQSARYWEAYYASLDLAEVSRRDCPHPINSALDAGSFFLHGILLRWILFHRFSPSHGFLHRPTSYPALVYDLVEPYRVWFESAVAEAWRDGHRDEKALTSSAIAILKRMLDEPVYAPVTRQTVRRKSLLHGIVLSLRAWLIGKQARFVVPTEGVRKGGRPIKVGFSMPGSPTGQ